MVHVIKEDRGNNTFLVHNTYTNEENVVTVDPDKIDIFLDKSIFNKIPHACRFFRHKPGSEKAYCTVHLTRPEICQDYGCWRLLILDHRGRRAGRIKFIRTLHSEDSFLSEIWEKCIENHQEPNDAIWEENMIRILTKAGFTVRR
jgi:Fe-S-cluster containining protein